MSSSFINRARDQRLTVDADQTEAAAYRFGAETISEGMYDDRVASSFNSFEPGGIEIEQRWHSDDLKADGTGGAIREELIRRQTLLGNSYPFQLNGSSLKYNSLGPGLYEFLLATSVAMNLTTGEMRKIPRLFERVVARVVALSFGDRTNSHHVGSPRDQSAGIGFKQAMNILSKKSGEWIWGPEDELDPTRTKDEGLDFVVWPHSYDSRKLGQLFVIGQCACGNDWESKFNDLTVKRLSKWFRPLSVVEPVRTFVVPFHLVDQKINEASRSAGYVYDRARLVSIDHHLEGAKRYSDYSKQMRELTDLVLKS